MSHLFHRYFEKHGHYPHVVVSSGVQRITVEFCPGYVRISSSPPYQATIWVTRRAFLQLLRKMVPLAKKMAQNPHPDHDVVKAQQEAYWLELQLMKDRREMKKTRTFDLDAESKRQRQRRRYLRAQERARQRIEDA